MSIALFDVNHEIVLLMYLADAWSSSSKGYFHVSYYPEGGGGVSDSTPYITTSFDRTGKLWVHNGKVQYIIENAASGEDVASGNLGDVANQHRVIKYIAIHCDRYSQFNLGDIRIKNIVVSEGLTTVSAPMYADGSYEGRVHSNTNSNLPIDVEGLQTTVVNNVIYYWTGPWPILHVVVNWEPIPGSLIKLHFGLDILPPFVHLYLEDSEFRFFAALSSTLGISEEDEPAVYTNASNLLQDILDAPWFLIATISRTLMGILGWFAPTNPSALAAFYAASIVYTASIVMSVIQTMLLIADGTIGILEGVLSLFFMGLAQIVPFGLIMPAFGLWVIGREFAQFRLTNGLVSSNRILELNAKASVSLFSMYLSLVMGAYLIGSALLIAVAYSYG